METLLKGLCDRSSFQNNCRALHSSAFSSEHPSVSLRVLLELAARWHRASAPSARTSLTDPLLIWCWRSSAQRAGSWAAFSDDSLISHEYRSASSYTAELYAQHASVGRHRGVLKRDLESYFNRTKLILHLGGLSEREVLHCKRLVLWITNSNAPGTELTSVNWNENSTASLIMSELSPV